MSETVSKKLTVTFNDGLPLGVNGQFTYQGEKWICIPFAKWSRILNASDKLISAVSRARALLSRRVGSHPEDAEWIVPALQEIPFDALVREKVEAQTS